MNVLISGTSGLIGSALSASLRAGGHRVIRLVRASAPAANDAVLWNPQDNFIDQVPLQELDAVVHLAGESVGSGRWNVEKKARIRSSRIGATRLLCATLAGLESPPRILISASATGFYGNRLNEILNESSASGSGFLSEVCRDWESATHAAEDAGIRVCHARFGIVLSRWGGALKQSLLPFRCGVGGPIGYGRQWWSWVALDDAIGALQWALTQESLSGAFNITAPNAVTNGEFARVLGRVLHRPAVLRAPALALRLALGEMADELLLSSARVQPSRLEASGFAFRFPDLEGALRHELADGVTYKRSDQ